MIKALNDRKFEIVKESYKEEEYFILSESDNYVQFYKKDSDGNVDLVFFEYGADEEQKLYLLKGEIEHLYKITR